MSGRGPGGGEGGPGYGYGPDDGYYYTPPGVTSPSGGSGGSNLPVWAIVVIMVGSGLLTLTVLGLCVLFVCRRRRARRATVRDLEAQTAWESERETARMFNTRRWETDAHADANKRCEESAGVELTFVIMAGEDQPSYLARPAANIIVPSDPPSRDPHPPIPSSPPPASLATHHPLPEKTPPSPS